MPIITGIQKYSIHDGQGIRSTVFFKGCPLSCSWCHNPETQNYQRQLSVDEERCSGCGKCLKGCETECIHLEATHAQTDFEKCTACGECADYCYQNLRTVIGEEYEVEKLVDLLKRDEMFYEESGGGVTLSGGEVMTQDMDYLEALLKKLTLLGISVNIDTCGYAPYANFERILPYVDTFLYDVKVIDDQKHRHHMGVSNTLILENLERLALAGASLNIRIPVVGSVNANSQDIKAIASYLGERKIQPVQINLLPYHNTGSGKYGRIGKEYQGETYATPAAAEMEDFAKLFTGAGFTNVKIGG
ncbi:pyruvate formate lyase activating enzyme [Lachnospiraceae bacterium PF1-21]